MYTKKRSRWLSFNIVCRIINKIQIRKNKNWVNSHPKMFDSLPNNAKNDSYPLCFFSNQVQ